jgi:hypothetical protein
LRTVIGFNGKEYKWNLSDYTVYGDNDRNARSNYHLKARRIIAEVFNSYRILEEVKLPGSTQTRKMSALFVDFYIPNLELAIEVHGEQHYNYVPFFHKSRAGFAQALVRDENKIEWCNLNNIKLITLKYSETEDEWRTKLRCSQSS